MGGLRQCYGTRSAAARATSARVPFTVVDITGEDATKSVNVYVRNEAGQLEVAGTDRKW